MHFIQRNEKKALSYNVKESEKKTLVSVENITSLEEVMKMIQLEKPYISGNPNPNPNTVTSLTHVETVREVHVLVEIEM